jgi:hypothetical protein
MYRRYVPLEAWERRALRVYARCEGWGAARQLLALLEAERLAYRAHHLLRSSLRAARSAAWDWRAPTCLLHTTTPRPLPRLEYRLYALFAE